MKPHTYFKATRLPWTLAGSGLEGAELVDSPDVPDVDALVHAVLTLYSVDAFRPRFSAQDWRVVRDYMVRRTVAAGAVLIVQGDSDRRAFLLESGALVVRTIRADGSGSRIALLRAGALVGEPALFGETVRMAQVDAIARCVVWSLARQRLDVLRRGHPDLAHEILRAAADGTAARVRKHLDAALDLEPKHAEAHVALGMYHAEIVSKIGSLLAGLTYRASAAAALEHFRRAVKLAPNSPIVRIEYANGLMLLNAVENADEAAKLYARAAACEAGDAMEQLDIERARRGPAHEPV